MTTNRGRNAVISIDLDSSNIKLASVCTLNASEFQIDKADEKETIRLGSPLFNPMVTKYGWILVSAMQFDLP